MKIVFILFSKVPKLYKIYFLYNVRVFNKIIKGKE